MNLHSIIIQSFDFFSNTSLVNKPQKPQDEIRSYGKKFKNKSCKTLKLIKNYSLFKALLICLIAIAFVSAMPAEEGIFADSVDALNPADDSEVHKLLKIKKILLLKKKIHHLG